MNGSLFDDTDTAHRISEGAVWLPGFAAAVAPQLLTTVEDVTREAPFRHMHTPGGHRMSVAMSNCGPLGWVTDGSGYRYTGIDPVTGKAWPALPLAFAELATHAAAKAGFPGFMPDACLINRYVPGARMSLHQDRNERNLAWPIVSVSLGLPVVFQFGRLKRSDSTLRVPLSHGDVVVWGGPARLAFHGVLTLKPGQHPLTGEARINLTFRHAGA